MECRTPTASLHHLQARAGPAATRLTSSGWTGELPPGLSPATDGRVSGTPARPGEWSFWVSIKDDPTDKPWCNPLSAEREFTIEVVDRLVIGPESASPGTVGVPYALAMTATLSDPKTWSVTAGALPPGLTLATGSGLISGTPTTIGSYPFTVRAVVDAARSDTKALTIDIRSPLSITASAPFDARARTARGEVGLAFRAALTASGGSGTYVWSTSRPLPPGLTFGANGTISGRPIAPGTYHVAASVGDSEGRAATYDATLSIAPRLSISTRLLHPARVGRPYRSKLVTSGGVKPVEWAAYGLPPGVRVDGARGIVTGTPRRVGAYRARVTVVDALGATSTRTLVVLVRA